MALAQPRGIARAPPAHRAPPGAALRPASAPPAAPAVSGPAPAGSSALPPRSPGPPAAAAPAPAPSLPPPGRAASSCKRSSQLPQAPPSGPARPRAGGSTAPPRPTLSLIDSQAPRFAPLASGSQCRPLRRLTWPSPCSLRSSCPQACLLSHPTLSQWLQGLKLLRGLQDWGCIRQPKFEMEMRVLIAQFLTRKNISCILILGSALLF